jgi:protein tyrosine phosphatase
MPRIDRQPTAAAHVATSPTVAPTDSSAQRAKQIFHELKEQTANIMPGESEGFGPAPQTIQRYKDLKFTPDFLSTPRDIGSEKRINGHLVTPWTIAMQAPISVGPSAQQYMVAMTAVLLDQKVGMLVDLTNDADKRNRRITYCEQSGNFVSDNGATAQITPRDPRFSRKVGAIQASERPLELCLAESNSQSKTFINYLNVPMTDHQGTDAESLHELAEIVRNFRVEHPDQAVSFHCSAGVGRTGMAIVAERLLNLADRDCLSHANLDAVLTSQVLELRASRSDVMVQNDSQMVALRELGLRLIGQNERERPGHRVAPAPNFPELHDVSAQTHSQHELVRLGSQRSSQRSLLGPAKDYRMSTFDESDADVSSLSPHPEAMPARAEAAPREMLQLFRRATVGRDKPLPKTQPTIEPQVPMAASSRPSEEAAAGVQGARPPRPAVLAKPVALKPVPRHASADEVDGPALLMAARQRLRPPKP